MDLPIDTNALLIWLAAGAITALITYTLIPGIASGGLGGALAFGLIGGVVGGFLGQQFQTAGMLNLPYTPILLAMLGGIVLVIIQKISFHQNKQFKTEDPIN